MRLWQIFAVLTLGSLLGCRGTDLVDHAKKQVDDSVEKADAKVEKLVNDAKASLDDSVTKARAEYKGALKDTSDEVTKLRQDLEKDLAELDRKTQERIEQLRASAAAIIAQGDKAVQARIDQLFAELTKFSNDTLAQIAKLIQPILDMAGKIGTAVENGDKHVAAILEKVTPILDSVKLTVDEVRKAILKLEGKDPETGKDSENPWWTRGILGLLTAAFMAWRKRDQKVNGDRWKREELEANTTTDVEKALNSGRFDDAIRARLVSLGVLRVSVAAPPREGGDLSSPRPAGGPPSSPP